MPTDSIHDTEAAEPAKFIEKGDKSGSAWLVALGQNNSEELFRDQFGAPHALVDGVPVPLDGGAHAWLRKLLWNTGEKTAKREDLAAATETLAMIASHAKNVTYTSVPLSTQTRRRESRGSTCGPVPPRL